MKIDVPCASLDFDKPSAWFSEWFNSPYYHILYQDRDEDEARFFIDNITRFLDIKPHHKLLDLASGKGRHSVYLNQKGFEVVGADLSKANIKFSKQFANERLSFVVHDMREVLRTSCFDYVLNLFTSFGYFEEEKENIKTLKAIAQNLKPKGTVLIDFFNPAFVVKNLIPYQIKTHQGIDFHLYKRVEDGFVIKNICFQEGEEHFHFQERVRLLDKPTFEAYFEQAGLEIQHIFGDYTLHPYQPLDSERMIFVVKKN